MILKINIFVVDDRSFHLHILQVPLTKIEVLDSLGESKVSGTATQNILESA